MDHFYFFRNTAEAKEVDRILGNMGVKTKMECACVKDCPVTKCMDLTGDCHRGTYIGVDGLYAPMIPIVLNLVRETEDHERGVY